MAEATQIEQLKSTISNSGGIARPNLYKVFLPSLSNEGKFSEKMNVLCKASQLPGRQILTLDRMIGMNKAKVAYGYAIDDITLTFYVTNDYAVKQYFETWMNRTIDNSAYEANYYNDYVQDVVVAQLIKGKTLTTGGFGAGGLFGTDGVGGIIGEILNGFSLETKAEEISYECLLEDAYPTTMTSIDLSNELDGLVELTVQLSYRNWRDVTGTR